MPGYYLKQPWTTKPPVTVPLDGSDPVLSDAKVVLPFRDEADNDVINEYGIYPGGDVDWVSISSIPFFFAQEPKADWVSGDNGVGIETKVNDGTIYDEIIVPKGKDASDIDEISFSPSGAFSVMMISSSNERSIVSKMNDSVTDGNTAGYQLSTESDGNLSFMLRSTSGGSNRLFVKTSGESYNDGEERAFLSTYDGSASASGVNLFVDGELMPRNIVDNNLSLSDDTDSDSWLRLGRLGSETIDSGGGSNPDSFKKGEYFFFALWDRELSAAEAEYITNNPYRIFQPKIQFVPTTKGGHEGLTKNLNFSFNSKTETNFGRFKSYTKDINFAFEPTSSVGFGIETVITIFAQFGFNSKSSNEVTLHGVHKSIFPSIASVATKAQVIAGVTKTLSFSIPCRSHVRIPNYETVIDNRFQFLSKTRAEIKEVIRARELKDFVITSKTDYKFHELNFAFESFPLSLFLKTIPIGNHNSSSNLFLKGLASNLSQQIKRVNLYMGVQTDASGVLNLFTEGLASASGNNGKLNLFLDSPEAQSHSNSINLLLYNISTSGDLSKTLPLYLDNTEANTTSGIMNLFAQVNPGSTGNVDLFTTGKDVQERSVNLYTFGISGMQENSLNLFSHGIADQSKALELFIRGF